MIYILLILAVFIVNIFFGMWRVKTRKFSLQWFAAIHLPIPFIFLLRINLDISALIIPVSLTAVVAGQIAGGKLYLYLANKNET